MGAYDGAYVGHVDGLAVGDTLGGPTYNPYQPPLLYCGSNVSPLGSDCTKQFPPPTAFELNTAYEKSGPGNCAIAWR